VTPLAELAGVLAGPDGAARLAELAPNRAAEVLALARAHGVEAWLAALAPAAWTETAIQRVRFAAAARRDRHALDEFGAVAEASGIRWLAVNGQATAESLYPHPSWRYAVDVDVLVPPARFEQLGAALTSAGWQLLDRNWPLLAATRPGELRFRSPAGVLFDVHWHLMTTPALRANFGFDTDWLLARGRALDSGLPALSGPDQLVHLAVHAALSGASRLSWLLDTGLAARAVTDWTGVAEAAAAQHAALPLALVLRRAARWLGTPSGPGSSWGWLLAAVDRLSPVSAEPERPALARSFARSARRSGPASLVEFSRHLSAFVRDGAPRTRRRSPLGDPADVRSPLHDVPDAAARARYFASLT